MGRTVGTLAVRIAAKTAEFNKGMQSASAKMKSFGRTSKKVAKASGAAFAAIGGSLMIVTRAASEQIKVEKQLAAAFVASGNALDMDSFKEFASGLQGITTTGDEAIIKMGAMLGTFGLLQGEIEAVIPSILDMAAATGRSADTISTALVRSIKEGTTSALKRYGLQMSEAEEATFKLGDSAERTAILVNAMSGFNGQAAIGAQTATGKFTQMTNSMGDLLERVGSVVNTPLAEFFDGVKESIDAVDGPIVQVAGSALLVGSAITGIVTAMGLLGLALPAVTAGFTAMGGAIKWAALQSLKLLPTLLPILVIGASLLLILGAGSIAWKAWGKDATAAVKFAWSSTKNFAKAMVVTFLDGFKMIGDQFTRFFGNISDASIQLMGMLSGLSPDEVFAIQQQSKAAGGLFGIEGTPAQAFLDKLDGVGSSIGDIGSALSDTTGDAMSGITDSFGEGVNLIKGMFSDIFDLGGTVGDDAGRPGARPIPVAAVQSSASAAKSTAVGATKKKGSRKVSHEEFDSASVQMQDAAFGMATSMGDAGSALGEVAQGFQAGGPIGGIIAAFVAIVSRTEGFARISEEFNNSFAQVIELFEPLVSAFASLFAGLSSIGNVTNAIAMVISRVEPTMLVLSYVFEKFADGMAWVAKSIAKAVNWVLEKLASLAFKLGLRGAARKLRASKIDISKLNATRDADEEKQRTLRTQVEKTTESFAKLNSELSNVPTGFKVSLRRQQSVDGESLSVESSQGAGNTIYIQALDLEDAARKLQTIDEFKSFTAGAQTVRRTPYSTARAGG